MSYGPSLELRHCWWAFTGSNLLWLWKMIKIILELLLITCLMETYICHQQQICGVKLGDLQLCAKFVFSETSIWLHMADGCKSWESWYCFIGWSSHVIYSAFFAPNHNYYEKIKTFSFWNLVKVVFVLFIEVRSKKVQSVYLYQFCVF